MAAGGIPAGWKIGATSGPVRTLLGAEEPFYGVLFAETRLSPGAVVDVSRLVRPLLECEVAFELGAELGGPGLGAREVLAATRRLYAAFELLGEAAPPVAPSRATDVSSGTEAEGGPPSLVHVIAANGTSAGYMLAASGRPPHEVNLKDLQVVLARDREAVARGQAGAVMGDPCRAVAWLAEKLAEVGGTLRAGEVVLSGSMTAPVALRPGDTFQADFGALGVLGVSAALPSRRAIIPS